MNYAKIREAAVLTQVQLGRMAGCRRSYVCDVEKGRKRASARLLAVYMRLERPKSRRAVAK